MALAQGARAQARWTWSRYRLTNVDGRMWRSLMIFACEVSDRSNQSGPGAGRPAASLVQGCRSVCWIAPRAWANAMGFALSFPNRNSYPRVAGCTRGLPHQTPRTQERAVRRAGQSASLAPFRFSERCRVSPHEGVAGDSKAAPAQGNAFPAEKCFPFATNGLSRGRRVDANERIAPKRRLRRHLKLLIVL
jgi:hypothetical protein